MELSTKSESEIEHYARSVIDKLIDAGNTRDWEAFSAPFVEEGQTDEAKRDVEEQWQSNPVLTSFCPDPVFLGVLRRSDHLITLWKMRCNTAPDDILGLLYFQEADGETKVSGYRIN